MKIAHTVLEEGVACLALTGDFDSFAANPFLEQIEAALQSGSLHVVVNLRFVLFINSTAVGSLIKARKRVRGLGGDLVIAEPSQRVRETLDLLGLGQVIKTFDSEAAATAHLRKSANEQVDTPSENAIVCRFSDPNLQKRFTEVGGVAKMAALEEGSITFTSPGETSLFPVGTPVKVKFRLPLFRRAYYFDFPCTIRKTDRTADGVKVTAEFGDILDEDRRAIAQFVRDLRLLREEIRGANG